MYPRTKIYLVRKIFAAGVFLLSCDLAITLLSSPHPFTSYVWLSLTIGLLGLLATCISGFYAILNLQKHLDNKSITD